jgi:hypothetical protein
MDFSKLSDEELDKFIAQSKPNAAPQSPLNFEQMSDADLDAFLQKNAPKVPPARQQSALEAGALDVGRGLAKGGIEGVSSVAMAPGAIANLLRYGAGWMADQTAGRLVNAASGNSWGATTGAREAAADVNRRNPLTPDRMASAIENNITGPIAEPQTTAGQYAQTIARNAPMAMIGPGTALQRGAMAVIPGVAEETAGQLTKGTSMEPYARAAAGLTAGVGTAMAMRPSYGDRLLGSATQGVTDDGYATAQRLKDDAQRVGVPVTGAEAIQRATGGASGLAEVQRRAENTIGGQEVMRPFMAQRGPQVDAAMQNMLGDIAPPIVRPQAMAAEAQRSAEGALNSVREGINAQTQHLYDASRLVRISPADLQALNANPAYVARVAQIRADPELSTLLRGLPEDSVGFVDAVKQIAQGAASRVGGPMSQDPMGNARAAVLGDVARSARQAGVNASEDVYGQALAEQARLRQAQLVPLESGPLGSMVRSQDPRGIVQALVPPRPLPGASGEVSEAAAALAAQNPDVARGVVRMSAEDAYNSARMSGSRVGSQADQFVGAEYAKGLRGEAGPVQDAAIRATAGPDAADRARRLVEVLATTGERVPAGSMTAFNQAAKEAQERGGFMGALSQAARPVASLRERVAQSRLENQSGALARLLIDENAIPAISETARRVEAQRAEFLARLLQSGYGAALPAADAVQ